MLRTDLDQSLEVISILKVLSVRDIWVSSKCSRLVCEFVLAAITVSISVMFKGFPVHFSPSEFPGICKLKKTCVSINQNYPSVDSF